MCLKNCRVKISTIKNQIIHTYKIFCQLHFNVLHYFCRRWDKMATFKFFEDFQVIRPPHNTPNKKENGMNLFILTLLLYFHPYPDIVNKKWQISHKMIVFKLINCLIFNLCLPQLWLLAQFFTEHRKESIWKIPIINSFDWPIDIIYIQLLVSAKKHSNFSVYSNQTRTERGSG